MAIAEQSSKESLVMQNWFHFMALLLQIKKEERDENFGIWDYETFSLRIELFLFYESRDYICRIIPAF